MSNNKKEKGFTMIELMIVVVIIGILAALAIPKFMRATTKTKQSEAKQLLKQIYAMQHAYRQEYDSYCCNGASAVADGSIPVLGIDIMHTARYTYTITANANSFTATATANLDDDPSIDTWTVSDSGGISCTINDANSLAL
jgi:prepilin-type N-terminal cleavage/methylation domain-containing protein